MKNITYLSPTSISLFYSNLTEFYLNYLAENRPPRIPQTQPMSVGSAFDAYAKSFLHEALKGKGTDPKFEFETLFTSQVESQNRDFAIKAGKHCFDVYRHSEALADLMLELQSSITEPKFELEVKGVVNGEKEGVTKNVGDIVFLGKPDLFFINKHGAHVILDWKVNGYCSKYPTSPMAGYVRLRDGGINRGQHRNAQCMMHNGVLINIASYLETHNEDWARQLAIYAWLCGEDVGSDFIVAIDQLCCKPNGDKPDIRVAEHRTRVNRNYQWKVFAQAQHIWEVVHSNHIFRDMPLEQSIAQQQMLDGTADVLRGNGSDNDKWFADITRK